jgi:hypothetical protein
MSKPTRYPNGIADVAPSSWNANIAQLDPTRYINFFEDFTSSNSFPVAASGLAAASNETWTVTVTEAGAGDAAAAYLTGTGAGGGVLSLTTDAADNDLIFAQRKGESYLLAAGKPCAFKIKFALTDASANADSIAQVEWYAGLMITDTDPLSSTAGDGVTDGIFFMSEDGTQDIKFHVQKNTSAGQLSTTLSSTLTVATMTSFAFNFDGSRYISIFKDDVYVTAIDLTATLTTYLPDAPLTVSFGVKNGEAVAKVMTIDYLYATMER